MENVYRFLFFNYLTCSRWQRLLGYLRPYLLDSQHLALIDPWEKDPLKAWAWQKELPLHSHLSERDANISMYLPSNKGLEEESVSWTQPNKPAATVATNSYGANRAVALGTLMQNGFLRGKSGIYICARVGEHLYNLGLDQSSVMAPLLYFLLQEKACSLLDLQEHFGEAEVKIVLGLARIDILKLHLSLSEAGQREKLYKLILSLALDARVIVVKIAFIIEKLSFLLARRNAGLAGKEIKQMSEQLIFEALHIYAPLAERIGMQHFKNKLQDLVFNLQSPQLYKAMREKMAYFCELSSNAVAKLQSKITMLLQEAGLNGLVISRAKQLYSIWQKMRRKKQFFSNLFDILALRIIVPDEKQCYQVGTLLREHFQLIDELSKDYIERPKANNYQALHIVVLCPFTGKMVEIQIRSETMQQVAELGLAAHWAYKQGVVPSCIEVEQLQFLRTLLAERINEKIGEPPDGIEEHDEWASSASLPAKEQVWPSLELLYPHVFCFTPQGDILTLPKGAIALDFAFAIHQDLGYFCRGARINSKVAPLNAELANGDVVEIIAGAAHQNMRASYLLKVVATRKARRCLRRLLG